MDVSIDGGLRVLNVPLVLPELLDSCRVVVPFILFDLAMAGAQPGLHLLQGRALYVPRRSLMLWLQGIQFAFLLIAARKLRQALLMHLMHIPFA